MSCPVCGREVHTGEQVAFGEGEREYRVCEGCQDWLEHDVLGADPLRKVTPSD